MTGQVRTAEAGWRWMRGAGRSLTVLSLVLLAGCASLGSTPESQIFDISTPSSFASGGKARVQLLVPVPSAISALATSRIVVRDQGAQISYFPGANWSDELPQLLQAKLVRSFENSGRARAVGRPGESLAIDDQVIVDIRAFELDVSGAPEAHVSFGVKLLNDRNGEVRASRVFDVREAAAGDSVEAAVAAIDRAASRALADVVLWTADAL